MATWKKVIVSGSVADLSSLSLDTALPVGSGGTGASSLTDGGVLLGSGTGAVTALGQATNGQLVIGSTGADPVLSTITQGSGVTITNSAGGITIAAAGSGGSVTSVGGEGTVNGLTLTGVVTASGSIALGGTLSVPNTNLVHDGFMIGSTDFTLGTTGSAIAGLSTLGVTTATATTVNATNIVQTGTVAGSQFTGSFSGSFTGTSNLPDLTDGNGIVDFVYDGQSAASVAIDLDGSTLSVGGSGLKIAAGGVGATELATAVAGAGLAGGGGTALSVNVDDSSIEINTDTLRVKAGGVTNAMLANDGFMIGSTDISLGATGSTVAGLTSITSTAGVFTNLSNSGTVANTKITGSFTGSFSGDGSNLTGVASTLNTVGDSGTGAVALKTQNLTIAGTANEIETLAGSQTVTIGLPNDVTIGNNLGVTNNLTVSKNLTVLGTASFQNTTDLDVADRFIRLASGSDAAGDGGIVIQQDAAANGEAFAFENSTLRWGITSSFDPTNNAITPDAFMGVVINGTEDAPTSNATANSARYKKAGNIYIDTNAAATDGGVWIYS